MSPPRYCQTLPLLPWQAGTLTLPTATAYIEIGSGSAGSGTAAALDDSDRRSA